MEPQWFLLAFSPALVRPPCSIVRYNNSDTKTGGDVRMCGAILSDMVWKSRNQMKDGFASINTCHHAERSHSHRGFSPVAMTLI